MIGQTLSGRYEVREQIATGGMGKVFAATDLRLGRDVALKTLREDLAHDPLFVQRFEREARGAAGLAHPNVAAVFDFGTDEGLPYIVMELVRGQDLSKVIASEGRLEPERAARLAVQIAAALGHAHAAGMVHRDVKPANVIVTPNDEVKVTDFGIARAANDSTLTATGTLLGTANYISPEQAAGRPATPASDVYCLGVVVYEMLTGRLPFPGESAVAVATRHMTEDVPPPSDIVRSVPGDLDAFVQTATAKRPEDRYPDGNAAAAALRGGSGGAAGTAVVAAPDRTQQLTGGGGVWPIPGNRWDSEKLGRRVLGGAAIAFLVAALLWMIWFASTDDAATRDERRRDRAAGQQEQRDPEPETGAIPSDIVGRPAEEVQAELQEAGFAVTQEAVTDSEHDPYLVDGSDPAPGSTEVPLTDPITLYVSWPPEEDGEDEEEDDDERGPPTEKTKGKGKGHGKDD